MGAQLRKSKELCFLSYAAEGNLFENKHSSDSNHKKKKNQHKPK